MWHNLPFFMQEYDSVCLQSQLLGDARPQPLHSLSKGDSELHWPAGGRGDGQMHWGLNEDCSPSCRLRRSEATEVLLIHSMAGFYVLNQILVVGIESCF